MRFYTHTHIYALLIVFLTSFAAILIRRTHNAALRINSLLVSAVRFAFRVHQFVRGFNTECISLFEQISVKMKEYPGSSTQK